MPGMKTFGQQVALGRSAGTQLARLISAGMDGLIGDLDDTAARAAVSWLIPGYSEDHAINRFPVRLAADIIRDAYLAPVPAPVIQELMEIAVAMSPENLTEDGNATSAAVSERRRTLSESWCRIQEKQGRAFTCDDVEELARSLHRERPRMAG